MKPYTADKIISKPVYNYSPGSGEFNMHIDQNIGEKREEILRIATRYGAHNVRLIGSVARGEARADSDPVLPLHITTI